MLNYDKVKIHFNMSIKILQTFSGSYTFIKIKQNNKYLLSRAIKYFFESEFKAYRLPYTGRLQHHLGFLTTPCILDIKNTYGHFHASSVLAFLSFGPEL